MLFSTDKGKNNACARLQKPSARLRLAPAVADRRAAELMMGVTGDDLGEEAVIGGGDSNGDGEGGEGEPA